MMDNDQNTENTPLQSIEDKYYAGFVDESFLVLNNNLNNEESDYNIDESDKEIEYSQSYELIYEDYNQLDELTDEYSSINYLIEDTELYSNNEDERANTVINYQLMRVNTSKDLKNWLGYLKENTILLLQLNI